MPWAASRSRSASSPATPRVIRPAPACASLGSMDRVAWSSRSQRISSPERVSGGRPKNRVYQSMLASRSVTGTPAYRLVVALISGLRPQRWFVSQEDRPRASNSSVAAASRANQHSALARGGVPLSWAELGLDLAAVEGAYLAGKPARWTDVLAVPAALATRAAPGVWLCLFLLPLSPPRLGLL